MCGRFSLTTPEPQLLERFSVLAPEEGYRQRYNCAPSQKMAVVTDGNPAQITMMKWGMTDIGIINARAETMLEKPAFQGAHRCLILADGFYEWKQSGAHKVPFRVTLPHSDPFAFAGIWKDNSFAIITVLANEKLSGLHERMPAILERHQEARWLKTPLADGLNFLGPHDGELEVYAVSPLVNSVGADTPAVVKPLTTLEDF